MRERLQVGTETRSTLQILTPFQALLVTVIIHSREILAWAMNLNNYFASNYQQKKVVVATVSVVVFLTQNVGNGPEAVAGEALQEPEHEEGDVVRGEGGQ